jgi:Fe-S cluster biogenesis protein NfuA
MEQQELIKLSESSLDSIRQYLKDDGGNVEIVGLTEDMVLQVKLLGNCSTCPQSFMTMKAGIEAVVLRAVPQIKKVEAVNLNAFAGEGL